MPTPPALTEPSPRSRGVAAGALALAVFLLFLPTLKWSPLDDDMEQLNLATALEMRWSGSYAVPTLQEEIRLNKPPGLPWLTAWCITDDTLRGLASPDVEERERARRALAQQARWPAHLMAAVVAGCAFLLGRTAFDARVGLIATAVCATAFMTEKYTRNATFDVPLALCAAVGQVCLAQWVIRGRRWLGAIGGGVALGMGMLTKGPVIFLFTVVPLLTILPFARRGKTDGAPRSRFGWALPAAVLLILAIAPVLPWVWTVVRQVPHAWDRWVAEITRSNATASPSGKWYQYVIVMRLGLPWTVWIVGGVVLAVRQVYRQRSAGAALLLAYLVVPILVLSLARDRKPHYLLPLACPLAVMAGRGLGEYLGSRVKGNAEEYLVVGLHWLVVAGLVVGVVVAPESILGRVDGDAAGRGGWLGGRANVHPWTLGLVAAAGLAVVVGGLAHFRGRRASIVVTTVAVALFLQGAEAFTLDPTRHDDQSVRILADRIWQEAPSADVYIHEVAGNKPITVQVAAEMELLLGRVVRWTPDPAAIRAGERPAALLLAGRAAMPVRVPEGWTKVAQESGRRVHIALLTRGSASEGRR